MRVSRTGRVFAALLALLLLCGCGAEKAPAPTETPEATATAEPSAEPENPVIRVADVDELIAAIGPNVTLELEAGTYDLASAASYGKDTGNPYCRWEDSGGGEGYELVIENTNGLSIRGAGAGETTLTADDRYASVLRFIACPNLTVAALTAGHTQEPGFCAGGVLRLEDCSLVTVEDCGLFGCGTVGVWAMNCNEVTVTGTRIYECSDSAVDTDSCRNVRVLNCEIDHNGRKIEGSSAWCLFRSYGGNGFTVSGCRVHDNTAMLLLQCAYTRNARFLSNRMEYNELQNAMGLYQYPATVDGCSFNGNNVQSSWYAEGYGEDSIMAQDLDGNVLEEADFAAMEYREIELEDQSSAGSLLMPVDVPVGGEVTVTTTDELLAAIGPDRTIVLEGDTFALSDASDYGGMGGLYFYWEDEFDGPQLVITGVSGLTIRAAAEDPAATTLTAEPRYANVIQFRDCSDVTISGFTMGHTLAPGYCTGGVLDFESCSGVTLISCRMYGCGVLGLRAWTCSDIRAEDCEIYDCSFGGVELGGCQGVTFTGCRIHDVPSPALAVHGCSGVLWEGQEVGYGLYDLDRNGNLLLFEYGDPNAEITAAPDSIALYYLGEELTELTIKEGDSVILRAEARFPESRQGRLTYSWSCDDPAALGVTVCRDNDQCIVKGLQAKEGGVLLTVTCNGTTETIRVTVTAR